MPAQLGISIEVYGVGSVQDYVSLTDDVKRKFVCKHIDGVSISATGVHTGREMPSCANLLQMAEANGEWMGVFENQETKQIAVCSDPFGYQVVFYTFFGNGANRRALVSASATGMAALLRKHGVPVDPDWTHIVGNFVSERPWTKTIGSDKTNLSGVRVLAPGEVLVLGKDFCGVTSSSFFSTPKIEYQKLLQRGIERGISQIEAASKLPLEHREIRLSGGRDSRIMVAMLIASGLSDRFTVTSVNPSTWPSVKSRPGLERDLAISAKIAQRYGFSWSKARSGVRTRLTFEESVSAWQTPFSNKNFELRTGSIHFLPDEWSLELRGGAGETFRGFRVVRGLLDRLNVSDQTSVGQGVETLADHLYGKRNLPNGIGDELSERLVELFEYLGTDNLAEGLHRRFAVYRNRAHFGHLRDSASKRSLPLLPLSQPEFVQARSLLSYEEQIAGIIAYDIVELLVPELNNLEFDDGPWDAKQLCGRPSVDVGKFDVDISAELRAYEATQKRNKKTLSASPVRRDGVVAFDAKASMLGTLTNAIEEIGGLPGADESFPKALRSTLVSKVRDGSRNSNLMLAKALGVLDLTRSGQLPNSFVFDFGENRLSALECGAPLIRRVIQSE